MLIKYLYIDDEPQKADGIIKPISDADLIFEIETPKTWNEQKSYLIESNKLNQYDGLLLDLKLQFADTYENEIKYKGSDLAQSIRTDVKSGKINDLPIFLCSTDNLMISLLDRTSYDLFDKKYTKDSFSGNNDAKSEFISFAKAYKLLNKTTEFKSIIGNNIDENLDDLVPLKIELTKCHTPHEIVYLIHNYVIKSNGLLLDDELLAIRLGVDIQNSPDWQKFKDEILREYLYSGILHECYDRWWQNNILKWWKEKFGKSLKIMSAQEKVTALIQKYELSNLVALILPNHHRFNSFWYKCKLSQFPLEPSDSLKTVEMPRYIWQEPSFISLAYINSDERSREDIIALLGATELRVFENL